MKHLISACCIMCIRWLARISPPKVLPRPPENWHNNGKILHWRCISYGTWQFFQCHASINFADEVAHGLPIALLNFLGWWEIFSHRTDEDFYGWKGWCGCNSLNQLVYLDGWHYWDMLRLRLTLWKWLCFEEMCSIWSIQFLRMVREFWVKYRTSQMIVDEKPYNNYFRFFSRANRSRRLK